MSAHDAAFMRLTVAALAAEIEGVRDRLSRCTDLFGQMLLTGKPKMLYRLREELAASVDTLPKGQDRETGLGRNEG